MYILQLVEGTQITIPTIRTEEWAVIVKLKHPLIRHKNTLVSHNAQKANNNIHIMYCTMQISHDKLSMVVPCDVHHSKQYRLGSERCDDFTVTIASGNSTIPWRGGGFRIP